MYNAMNDLMRLPRAGLKKRCGTALLDALDRATGEAPEVHEWLAARIQRARGLAGPH
jgi:protein ImuB